VITAVRCRIGEGAETGAGLATIARKYVGARRTANQDNGLAVAGGSCGPVSGSFIPRSLRFIAAASVDLALVVCRRLDGQADPPPPFQVRRNLSLSNGT